MNNADGQSAAPLFRSRKRRRIEYRRRDDDDEADDPTTYTSVNGSAVEPSECPAGDDVPQRENRASPSLNNVVKQRKHNKARRLGFTVSSNSHATQTSSERDAQALVPAYASPSKDKNDKPIAKRFVKQTGRAINEADAKHEDDFIDRRLAELNGARSVLTSTTSETTDPTSPHSHTQPKPTDPALATSSGQLQEVSITDVNALRKSHRKTRPLPHNRKPRERGAPSPTKDDLARDRALEAVLTDASLDYYSKPADDRTREKDMDEVLAHEFEQEFREQQEERRQRQPPMNPAEKNAARGPKLGGSRSQRAVHHAEEKKKRPGGVMPT